MVPNPLIFCKHKVQVLFHSPPGVLFHLSFTVLLRYRSLGILDFWGWSPHFLQLYPSAVVLWILQVWFQCTGLPRLWSAFQNSSHYHSPPLPYAVRNPRRTRLLGLASFSLSLRRYLGDGIASFLPVLLL